MSFAPTMQASLIRASALRQTKGRAVLEVRSRDVPFIVEDGISL